MKRSSKSEKLLLEEIALSAEKLQQAARGLPIGELIALIRNQLQMSQSALAKRAGIPQATVSRIEQSQQSPTLATLSKISEALCCELVVIPMLKKTIDAIRRQQAKQVAQRHVQYLKGTMNLEKQEPDIQLLDELVKEEENELLNGSGTKLWEK